MVFVVFWWSPFISQKLQLVHPALQGSRHGKCKLESHCWNAFASQIKPVQAKAAWSRAAGIVSSSWQVGKDGRKEGRRGASMSAALKDLDSGFWQFLVSFLLSFFVFSFSFSLHIPSAAASPREGSQWHPRSFPVTDFLPITGEELSKAGTIFLEVFALSASVFIFI